MVVAAAWLRVTANQSILYSANHWDSGKGLTKATGWIRGANMSNVGCIHKQHVSRQGKSRGINTGHPGLR